MDITITPKALSGIISAIPSKSQAHRLLICAAFSDGPTFLSCPLVNQDILATAGCLEALGARITRTDDGFQISPVLTVPQKATLFCGESGSTLRFMLPICGALGVDTRFQMEGRLPERPLSPLWEEMERMGCHLSYENKNTLLCTGKLRAGSYAVSGGVSSQFITGLLYAMALIKGNSSLTILGRLESAPYVEMTRQALLLFGVSTENNHVVGSFPFHTPGQLSVEGDWSNSAFFLGAQALNNPLEITGLSSDSFQGDRIAAEYIPSLKNRITLPCSQIPDLVPILAVVAAANKGAVFTEISRLRLKESDRVASVMAMLQSLGIQSEADETTLTVYPGTFTGGTVDSQNDHRIAMAAAIAATAATGPVTILGAQCVAKSYPSFWQDYLSLGGNYEQYIR